MGSITDIPGISVGHSSDYESGTGCTVILFDDASIASADMRGGGTSTRQIDGLLQNSTYGKIHAILLTGGSAFGLNAASGVMKFLEERDIGLNVGRNIVVPSVPSAVIFDLGIGNGKIRPDSSMGYDACVNSTRNAFLQGSVGVGTGATIGKMYGIERATKGGLGSMSLKLDNGVIVGVLVVVNAFGDVYSRKENKIIAGARKSTESKEFVNSLNEFKEGFVKTYEPYSNTTLAVIITNASLNKSELNRIAIIGQTGISRSILPVNTISDGDVVFAASAGKLKGDANSIGIVASDLIESSIVKAVKISESLLGVPAYNELI
ncbi:MAG: peptidase S58 family protein [Candidatus Dadabacteria bacterium]|nr:peptidase S58 family protein [Candidatus Dadabacteria bacterium]NIQ14165.1 peptidase S58 family protein [Candidatus Dadabacteria bacterium]